jgi:hypothetical protein
MSSSVWYEWRDNPVDFASAEAHFGLLRRDTVAKAPLSRELPLLSRASIVRQVHTRNPRLFALLLRDGERLWLAHWLRTADLRESAAIMVDGKRQLTNFRPQIMGVSSVSTTVVDG